MIDMLTIFHKMEPRSLKAAYKFYGNGDLANAHDAQVDVRASYEVLKSQVQRYINIPYIDTDENESFPIKNDVSILSEFTPFEFLDPTKKVIYNSEGRIVFNFGKYKDRLVSEVLSRDSGYLDWMITSDFSPFTIQVCKAELQKAMRSNAA